MVEVRGAALIAASNMFKDVISVMPDPGLTIMQTFWKRVMEYEGYICTGQIPSHGEQDKI